MTVTYSKDVATVQPWTFIRLLLKWRGSIYKLVLPDLTCFVLLFALFSLTYRFAMPPKSKEIFELFCIYCGRFENLIPLAFVLGFFVQLIASRWWEQFIGLPYPDNLALMLNVYIDDEDENEASPTFRSSGKDQTCQTRPREPKSHVDGVTDTSQPSGFLRGDEPGSSAVSFTAEEENEIDLGCSRQTPTRAQEAHLLRRTIMRYVNLSMTATYRRVAYPVRKKIPNEEDFVKLKLMTEDELTLWNAFTIENKYFLPLIWCNDLIVKARKKGLIKNHYFEHQLLEEIESIRGKLGMIFTYDYINPPLSYTQAATISVYSYFLACLFGRQFLDPAKKYDKNDFDFIVPIFTVFQFLFYVGWLKVAEELINPYGKDDDDFEILWLLKRNKQMSATLIDPKIRQAPATQEDPSWDTTDSAPSGVQGFHVDTNRFLAGSAMNISHTPSKIGNFFRTVSRQHSAPAERCTGSPSYPMEDMTSPGSDTSGPTVRKTKSSPTVDEEIDLNLLCDVQPDSSTPKAEVLNLGSSQPLAQDSSV